MSRREMSTLFSSPLVPCNWTVWNIQDVIIDQLPLELKWEIFANSLNCFDWFYSYSDDHRVFTTWNKRATVLTEWTQFFMKEDEERVDALHRIFRDSRMGIDEQQPKMEV